MKKLMLSFLASLVLAVASFAQTTQPMVKKSSPTMVKTMKQPASPVAQTKTIPIQKKEVAEAAKPEMKQTTPPVAKTNINTGPLKKDGTKDMRFKVNKAADNSQVVHLKKDGSKDMRYKENKKHS